MDVHIITQTDQAIPSPGFKQENIAKLHDFLSKQDSFERWVQLIRVIGEYRQGLTDLCFYKLEPLTLDFFQNVILLLTIVGFLRGGCSRGGG